MARSITQRQRRDPMHRVGQGSRCAKRVNRFSGHDRWRIRRPNSDRVALKRASIALLGEDAHGGGRGSRTRTLGGQNGDFPAKPQHVDVVGHARYLAIGIANGRRRVKARSGRAMGMVVRVFANVVRVADGHRPAVRQQQYGREQPADAVVKYPDHLQVNQPCSRYCNSSPRLG